MDEQYRLVKDNFTAHGACRFHHGLFVDAREVTLDDVPKRHETRGVVAERGVKARVYEGVLRIDARNLDTPELNHPSRSREEIVLRDAQSEGARRKRAMKVYLEAVGALQARTFGEARVESGTGLDEAALETERSQGADGDVEV
jgi:hypothetical protein